MKPHRRAQAAAFLVAPTACAARPVTGVPSSAAAASTQIRTAVHTALASGKRRLCVDLLLSALDARAPTYDADAAETVFVSLVSSLQSVLPRGTGTRVVVPGPNAALRATNWASRARLSDVSVDLLGVKRASAAGDSAEQALLLLSPPSGPARVSETRAELAAAHSANIPVVTHNHPRDDAVFASLGHAGVVSRELWTHDTAYLVAPFAIQAEGVRRMRQDGSDGAHGASDGPVRFVLMRQMPGCWQLWKLAGGRAEARDNVPAVALQAVDSDYVLCHEYNSRPDDEELFRAVQNSLS